MMKTRRKPISGVISVLFVLICFEICQCHGGQQHKSSPSPSSPVSRGQHSTDQLGDDGQQHKSSPSPSSPVSREQHNTDQVGDVQSIRPSASRDQPTTSIDSVCPAKHVYCKHSKRCVEKGKPCKPKPLRMLKHGLPLQSTFSVRQRWVALSPVEGAPGTWEYSTDRTAWKRVVSSAGRAMVLSLTSFLRFRPREGFHGAAKIDYIVTQPPARDGQLVAMPTPSGTVATLVFPPLPFTIEHLVPNIEYEEDQKVEVIQLSKLFQVTKKSGLALSANNDSLDRIPKHEVKPYLSSIKDFNGLVTPAVTIVTPPDVNIVKVEYKYSKRDKLKPLKMVKFHPHPLPLNASVRLSLLLNANGRTRIGAVAAMAVGSTQRGGTTLCQRIGQRCYYGHNVSYVQVFVSPKNDRPIIVKRQIMFSPLPDKLDATYQKGVAISTLMRAEQYVVEQLLKIGKGNTVRKVMAGSKPETLCSDLPQNQRFSCKHHQSKPGRDWDGDSLGIAILCSSANSSLGRWLYNQPANQSWIPLTTLITPALKGPRCNDTCVVLLQPRDRLKFEPKNEAQLWDNVDAKHTILELHVWDRSDNKTTGGHCVDTNTISYSEATTFMTATRLGCDGNAGSTTTKDLCGVCGGKNDCVRCDGTLNSTANSDCGVCYGGRTGNTKPERDCAEKCNTSYVDECGVCQIYKSKTKNFKDCAGTCRGKPGFGARLNKCKICAGGNSGRSARAGMDACGVCRGDNSTCDDCKGTINGPYKLDQCKLCKMPGSSDFNECQQITSVDMTDLPALERSTLRVTATGIKTVRAVTCSLKSSANRVALKEAKVKWNEANSVSHFEIEIPATIAPGAYFLECTLDSSKAQVEFTNKTLKFYNDQATVIKKASPDFALRNKSTTVLLSGSGFVDSAAAKCFLERNSVRSYFKVQFINQTHVQCFVKVSLRTPLGEYGLGVSFSPKQSRLTTIAFDVKVVAPRPVSCKILSSKFISIVMDAPSGSVKPRLRCADIFSKSSLKLLQKSKCQFENVKTLRIRLAPSNKINLTAGVTLGLLYRGLRNAQAGTGRNTKYTHDVHEIKVQCQKLSKRKKLTVDLIGARTAGSCEVFKLRAQPSGASPYQFTWSVSAASQSLSDAQTKDLEEIKSFLSKLPRSKRVLVLHKNFIKIGVTYKLQVTVQDRYKQQDSVIARLTRRDNSAPTVEIDGDSVKHTTVKLVRNRRFKLIAKLKTASGCRQRDVRLTWSCKPKCDMVQQTTRSPKLFIKNLRAGQTYNFSVTAELNDNPSLFSVASTTVITKRQPLECIIRGGNHRVIGQHEPLKLNGRQSNDPDNEKGSLQYSWTCLDTDGYSCYVMNNTDIVQLNIPDSSVVTIDTSKQLQVNKTYTFTLTVSKEKRSRKCSTQVDIKQGSPPKCRIFNNRKIYPNKRNVIVLKVESPAEKTSYEFRFVQAEGYAFSERKKRGVIHKRNSRKISRTFIPVVLKRDELVEDATYKIRFTANYNNVFSYVEQDLVTKAPPIPGVIEIEPRLSGTAMDTVYTFSAMDGWDAADEEDRPLKFRFGYYVTTRRGKRKKIIKGFSEDQQCEKTLPPGDKRNNFTLTCFIEACDANDACSVAEQDVIVLPKEIDANETLRAEEEVKDSMSRGDLAGAAGTLTTLLSATAENKNETEAGKDAKQSFVTSFIHTVLSSNEDGKIQEKEDRDTVRESIAEATSAVERNTFDPETKLRISDNIEKMERPKVVNDENQGRRRRRSVGEPNVAVFEEKTANQVESTITIYKNLINPEDLSNDTMKIKDKFLGLLGELGRSLCKGLTSADPPVIAETGFTAIRSEMNSFEHVVANYSLIGCDKCAELELKNAQVLLGKTLRDTYDNWDCTEDGCNGACVVSAQIPHDLLASSESDNKVRVSDVFYTTLFNPKTLAAMAIINLASPVSFKIPLVNATNDAVSKCYVWDVALSNWSLAGIETASVSSGDLGPFVTCTSSQLGLYVTVFEMKQNANDVNQTTTQPTTSPPTKASASHKDTASNQQTDQTTNSTAGTTTAQLPGKESVQLQLSLVANYEQVINYFNSTADFLASLSRTIGSVLGIHTSRIGDLTVRPGSIVVSFVLSGGDVANLTTNLRTTVQNGNFSITLPNGQILKADPASFKSWGVSSTAQSTTVEQHPAAEDSQGLSQATLIGIIVGCVVLVLVIVGGLAFYCHSASSKKKKVRAWDENGSLQTLPTNAQEFPMDGFFNEDNSVDCTDVQASLPGTPHTDKQ